MLPAKLGQYCCPNTYDKILPRIQGGITAKLGRRRFFQGCRRLVGLTSNLPSVSICWRSDRQTIVQNRGSAIVLPAGKACRRAGGAAGEEARHGLAVIEDAAEAIGARARGRRVGTHGNPAVFAFYPNKQITTGEGGMLTTDDADVQAGLQSLTNQERTSPPASGSGRPTPATSASRSP